MTSLSEQLSEARKRQFNAQLDSMRTVTAQAFATAEQVLALNINTSRASVERTANTVRQLFSITDPRELFTVGSSTQEQLGSLFAYGHELLNIATDARLNLSRHAAELPVPQPEKEPVAAQTAPAVHADAAKAQAPKAAAAKPSRKPVVLANTAETDAPPRARAKAVGKVTGKRAAVPHLAASPVATEGAGEVHLAQPRPVDSAPSAAVLEMKDPGPPAPTSQRKK